MELFRVKDYLLHMLESAERILLYTKDKSLEDFEADTMLQDAVIRNIEIIGEAASSLLRTDPEFAARTPSIPFAQIYGMRNRVAHGYFAVSISMVWETVEIDIPELRKEIGAALRGMEPND
jgi:uncharacterized protein with HEPN domain